MEEFGNSGIDNLPDNVFHRIFSFLNIFDDLSTTSVVSNKWKNLWSEMPYLNFDVLTFCRRRNIEGDDRYRNLKKFIDWVLMSRATHIVRFQLDCRSIFHQQDVYQWIWAVGNRNVEEVILSFLPSEEAFALPYSLVTSDDLKVLKLDLSGRVLRLPRYSGFSNLKCLYFNNLGLREGELAQKLFSECPLLENLTLRNCTLGDDGILDISSASIRSIFIENTCVGNSYRDCAIKISCPNLLSFKYYAPRPRCFVLDNLSLLESLGIELDDQLSERRCFDYPFMCGVLKVVRNLISLKLSREIVLSLCYFHDEFISSLITFDKLKCLNISVGCDESRMHFMALLLKHSPNLETLNIHLQMDQAKVSKFEDFSGITCFTSHLKFVRLIDFAALVDDIELVRILLVNGLVLKKLVIVAFDNDANFISKVVETVMKFPRSSSSVVIEVLPSTPLENLLLWKSL